MQEWRILIWGSGHPEGYKIPSFYPSLPLNPFKKLKFHLPALPQLSTTTTTTATTSNVNVITEIFHYPKKREV
jgi:hypothetical protein